MGNAPQAELVAIHDWRRWSWLVHLECGEWYAGNARTFLGHLLVFSSAQQQKLTANHNMEDDDEVGPLNIHTLQE